MLIRNSMNILHISTSDSIGGAARACVNISDALNSIGVISTILVQQKKTKNESVKEVSTHFKTGSRIIMDYFLMKSLSKSRRGRFTFPFVGTEIYTQDIMAKADIINLHWVNGGFLSLMSLENIFALNKPVVWTFHDMWVFTGGCHYTGGCTNFLTICKDCPALIFSGKHDLSNRIFRLKEKLFRGNKFSVITCSNWLAKESERSHLLHGFDITVVPNPIDTSVFHPFPAEDAKKALKLSKDKIVFLFSAFTVSEVRKGFNYFKEALLKLSQLKPELRDLIEIVVLGSSNKNDFNEIPFEVTFTGRLDDINKLVLFYSAADLFIAPSVQENLSNTVMESLACGTPVLAFNIGGMPDMIENSVNGFLVDNISAYELSKGMQRFIEMDIISRKRLREHARKKVMDHFSPARIADQYTSVYKKLMNA